MNGTNTPRTFGIDGIVGTSAGIRRVRSKVIRIAGGSSDVLITGPTGTGKELIARAIHAHSPRAARPYIAVDCAAVQGSLFTSELFGHVEGAFTGATHASLGCFRAAEGGTIMLDEIGELEPESQAKLLRVIQEKTVVPVGSHEEIPVDVRIITATNRNLAEAVAAGHFREDLYYRLNVVSLRLAALEDHLEDVEPLAEHFLKKLATEGGLPLMRLSGEAIVLLKRHHWPGNIRELQNLLERAAVFAESNVIDARLLSSLEDAERKVIKIGAAETLVQPCSDDRLTLAEVEREHICRMLKKTDYNQTVCARSLGIDRRQLARKIEKHGIPLRRQRRGRPPRRAA